MNHDEHVGPPRAFLSYARADRIRIAKLAAALRAAGIDVWWDAAIEAGSAFRNDIARELDAADVVVVAWSTASINSAWVLDEAAVGRDRGRLAPILFDAVKPPLGFRQLQSVDLSSWRGDSHDPRLARVVEAVKRIAVGATPPMVLQAPKPPTLSRRGILWIVGLLVTSFVLALGWQLLSSRSSASKTAPGAASPEKPVVAVLPFTDMSTKGEAYFAQGLAEEIQDSLARDGRLKVFGGATARAIRDRADDPAYARDKLGVTRLLEGSVRGGAAGDNTLVRVSVRLIDTGNGLETWSQSFDRRGKDVISIQKDVATAVVKEIAGPLVGTVADISQNNGATPEAYEETVVSRQLIRAREADSLLRARDLASKAISAAPGYAPAYAARAAAVQLLATYGGASASEVRAQVRRDADMAIRLNPTLSDGYAALSLWLWDNSAHSEAIRVAGLAIVYAPNNAEAHLHLAYFLAQDDQINRALAEFKAANALDPLWFVPVLSEINMLGAMNQPVSGRNIAESFKALSVDPAEQELVTSGAEQNAGNIATAIRLASDATARNPKLTIAAEFRDQMKWTLFAAEGVGSDTGGDDANGLLASRNITAAAAVAARMGTTIWAYESASNFANALAAAGRWNQLLHAFDERFGSAARYASSTASSDRSGVTVALALGRAGRVGDALAMRAVMRERLSRAETAGVTPAQNSIDWAGILVAEGDRGGAMTRLESGVSARWWAVCGGPFWLGDLPTLAPLHGDRRFEALLERCRSRIAAERKAAGMGPISLN